jgi:hypothetical protein
MTGKGHPSFQITQWLKNVHSSPQLLCVAPGELDDGQFIVSTTKASSLNSTSSSIGRLSQIEQSYTTEAMEDSEDHSSTVSSSANLIDDRPILVPRPPMPRKSRSSRSRSPTRTIMSLLEQAKPPIRFCQPTKSINSPAEVTKLRNLLSTKCNVGIIPAAFKVSVTPLTLRSSRLVRRVRLKDLVDGRTIDFSRSGGSGRLSRYT